MHVRLIIAVTLTTLGICSVAGCVSRAPKASKWLQRVDSAAAGIGSDLKEFNFLERKLRFSRRKIPNRQMALYVASTFSRAGLLPGSSEGRYLQSTKGLASRAVIGWSNFGWQQDSPPKSPHAVINSGSTDFALVVTCYNSDPVSLAAFLTLARALAQERELPLPILFFAYPSKRGTLGVRTGSVVKSDDSLTARELLRLPTDRLVTLVSLTSAKILKQPDNIEAALFTQVAVSSQPSSKLARLRELATRSEGKFTAKGYPNSVSTWRRLATTHLELHLNYRVISNTPAFDVDTGRRLMPWVYKATGTILASQDW